MAKNKKNLNALNLAFSILLLFFLVLLFFNSILPVWQDGKIGMMPVILSLIICLCGIFGVLTYFQKNKPIINIGKSNIVSSFIALISFIFLCYSQDIHKVISYQLNNSNIMMISISCLFGSIVIYGIIAIIMAFFSSKKDNRNYEDYDDENNLDNIDVNENNDELTDEELERIGEKPKHKKSAPRHMATKEDSDNENDEEEKDNNSNDLPEKEELDKPLDAVEEEQEDRVAPRKEADEDYNEDEEISSDDSLESKLAKNNEDNNIEKNKDYATNDDEENNKEDKKIAAKDLKYDEDEDNSKKNKKKLIKK